MTKHVTGTRKEWLAARLDLLEAEKELTRRSDELARGRQELPWVRSTRRIDSRPMKGAPHWQTSSEGARSSSSITLCSGPTTRRAARTARQLRTASTGSRFTLPTTMSPSERSPGRRSPSCRHTSSGWGGRFPWASSVGGDFNFDFNVSFTEEQQQSGGGEYNFEPVSKFFGQAAELRQPEVTGKPGPIPGLAASVGTDWPTYTREAPGMSAFAFEDGVVFHTYSTYARGLDVLWGMYQWLDRAPKGRNETGIPAPLWRRHDEYDTS